MRRWIGRLIHTLLTLVIGTFVLLLCAVGQVEASEGIRGDKCVVEIDQHITEDFYFLCRRLDVYGRIDGDLIGVAVEVTLWPSSIIMGDVWIGGGKLEVAGKVGDDMHFGGVTVIVREESDFSEQSVDLATVALSARIDSGARLSGDLLVYSYQSRIDGAVGGEVNFSGEALIINGTVEGRVDASVGDARRNNDLPALPFWDVSFHDPGLWLGDEAAIVGDLVYRSASPSIFSPEIVGGNTSFTLTNQPKDITKAAQPNEAAQIAVEYLRDSVTDVITLLIVGLLVLRLIPRAVRQPASHVRQHIVSAVGWGLVTFMFSVPVAIVIVLLGLILLLILYIFKLVGLMMLITVALMIAGSGLLGGFYFLLYFMGRVVISFLIGQMLHRYVLHLPDWGQMRQWVFTLAIGTVVYALISNIPLPAVGLIFELVTALAGGGAVIMTLRDAITESGLFAQRPAAVLAPAGELVTITPVRRERQPEALPPGMANLPPGFTGFDENW